MAGYYGGDVLTSATQNSFESSCSSPAVRRHFWIKLFCSRCHQSVGKLVGFRRSLQADCSWRGLLATARSDVPKGRV
jgi:hypothetical protein